MLFRRSCQLLTLASVCCLPLWFSACSKPEKEPDPVVSVETALVTEEPMERVISTEAVIYPIQQAAITPKISAPVKRFLVNRGTRVRAGQLLAVLEDRDLKASEIENKGTLAQAEANYNTTTRSNLPEEIRKAELDAENSKQALDAEQTLFESRQALFQQAALPRKDLDQARVNLTQAKSQYAIAQQHWNALQAGGKEQELKSASGQLQAARGKYLGSQAQLSYSEIRSPINGVVTERPLYPGEMATQGIPLLVVMDTATVIAKAHIPQEDAALLKVGSAAGIVASGSDQTIAARITVVSPAVDPNSTTVEVWAQAGNSNNRLRPGANVQLSITAAKVAKTLVAPASALLKQPDGSFAVMTVGPDSRAHLKPVQIGIQNAGQVQITSGLETGEHVIVNGAYGLPDKTKVNVAPFDSPAKGSAEKTTQE